MAIIDNGVHRRKSIRLSGYDYSQPGAYFVTLVSYQRFPLFGNITEQEMTLNQFGKSVKVYWGKIPDRYPNIQLDTFIIMPNHLHGIINIDLHVGAGLKPARKRNHLSEIIRSFKTFSAREINELRGLTGVPVWQRNYYEHIIRDDEELSEIREYISSNVLQWEMDTENPEGTKQGQV